MSRPGPRKVMEGLGGESQGRAQAAKASRQAYDKNATYRRFPFHLGQVGGRGGETTEGGNNLKRDLTA